MLPTVSLGPVVLPTGPLTIILGMWVTLAVVEHAARAVSVDVQATYGVASTGLLSGIIGARVAFVILHWPAYENNLLGVIWPINSGFEPLAGLLVGIFVAFFYGRWRALPLGKVLDALAPAIALGLAFVSLADFLAGPGYGEPTTMPWGISMFGIRRHPVQLYEIIVSMTAFAAWFGSVPPRHVPMRLFLVTTAILSAGRLLVDPYRANAPLTADGFHVIQLVGLTLLMAALVLMARQAPASPSASGS